MEDIISKVLPIILLILIGYYMNYNKILEESTVNQIKKIVINMALPSVIFLTFKDMELKEEYFTLTLIVFVLLIILYFIGLVVNKISLFTHPILPFLTTGFTFGLLGIPLYGSVFGSENLDKIAVLGIGHEFFIWFVFYTLLKSTFNKNKFSLSVLKDFIKSPFIIAVILGLLLNAVGLNELFDNNMITSGINKTLQYISNLATPLILLVIGYGIKLDKKYMKQSTILLCIRMLVVFVIGYIFKWVLIDKIMETDKFFDYAYFTLLILPPPFSLPIFVGEYSTKENSELANNTVVLNTIVSIIGYIVFVTVI